MRGLPRASMHELSIATSVIDTLRAEAAKVPGRRILGLKMRIGALTALDEDSFRFGMEALVRDTELEGLKLEVEHCPRRQRCEPCGNEFNVQEYELGCPACGSVVTSTISGDELDISWVEVEDA
jgi:hydrogenase nickel incorporation protein HypA/HybF